MGARLLHFARTLFTHRSYDYHLALKHIKWESQGARHMSVVLMDAAAITRMAVLTLAVAGLLIFGGELAADMTSRLFYILSAITEYVEEPVEEAEALEGVDEEGVAAVAEAPSLREAVAAVMQRVPMDEPGYRPVSTTAEAGALAEFFRTKATVTSEHDRLHISYSDTTYVRDIKPMILDEARNAYLIDLLTGRTELGPTEWLNELSGERITDFSSTAEQRYRRTSQMH